MCVRVRVCDAQIIQIMLKLRGSTPKTHCCVCVTPNHSTNSKALAMIHHLYSSVYTAAMC